MEVSRQGAVPLLVRVRRCFVPLMVLMGISVCLQIAGCVSPGWVIVKYDDYEVNIGLWIVNYCVLGECKTKSIEEIDQYGIVASGLTEYRVETILGLLLISTAIVAGGISRQPGRLQVTVFSLIILSLISGILALIASGKVADDTRKENDLLQNLDLGEDSPIKFPYSVFLTGLGGILACITSLVALCCVKPCTNESDPPPAYQLSPDMPQQFPVHAVPHPTTTQPYLAQPYLAQTYPTQQYPVQEYPVQPYAAQSQLDHSFAGPRAMPDSMDDIGQHYQDNSQDLGNFGSDLEPIVPRK